MHYPYIYTHALPLHSSYQGYTSCVSYTAKHKGSISAEHGLGFKKSQYIYHSKSKEAVEVMKDLKHLFDPKVSCATMLLIYIFMLCLLLGYSQSIQNSSSHYLKVIRLKFMYSVHHIQVYKLY